MRFFIFGFKKICTRDYPSSSSTVHCSKLEPPKLSKDFLLTVGRPPQKHSNHKNTQRSEGVMLPPVCLIPSCPPAEPSAKVIRAPPHREHGALYKDTV